MARRSSLSRRWAGGVRRPRVSLEDAPHFDADLRQITLECRAIAVDEPEVDERDREIRVGSDVPRQGPAEVAAGFGARRSVDLAGAEQMHEEVKAADGRAPDLVHGDGIECGGAVARFLKELAPSRVPERLVWLHSPARQEPCARERC